MYQNSGDTWCTRIKEIQGVPELRRYRVYQNSGDTGCTRIKEIQGVPKLRRYRVYQNLGDTGCNRRIGNPFKVKKTISFMNNKIRVYKGYSSIPLYFK